MTKDPEVRALPNGTKVTSFGVATNRNWKDANGAKQEEVEFHNTVAFGKVAEIIGQYVKKGQLIFLQGRLKTQSWEKDGVKKYKTEVIVEDMQMGPKAAGGSERPAAPGEVAYPTQEEVAKDISVDDIPW